MTNVEMIQKIITIFQEDEIPTDEALSILSSLTALTCCMSIETEDIDEFENLVVDVLDIYRKEAIHFKKEVLENE